MMHLLEGVSLGAGCQDLKVLSGQRAVPPGIPVFDRSADSAVFMRGIE
jgi:hypothetical protein